MPERLYPRDRRGRFAEWPPPGQSPLTPGRWSSRLRWRMRRGRPLLCRLGLHHREAGRYRCRRCGARFAGWWE